jgi:mTERF domain-containing protein
MALQLRPPPPFAALGRSALPSCLFPSATARRARAVVAFSLQTNVRLLKPNRRSRRSRYPYYDLDDDEDEEEEDEDDEESEVSSPNASNHC